MRDIQAEEFDLTICSHSAFASLAFTQMDRRAPNGNTAALHMTANAEQINEGTRRHFLEANRDSEWV
ncbi:hypothetical protein LTS09_016297 [Friedmanniomyces endolithicus]|nr:hypothetical protein LTS09_016297 [Friedmanniomyces endolithicus]